MDALLLAKPDIAFAIDQLRSIVRIQIVSFRITGRHVIKHIRESPPCIQPQHAACWENPNAVGSVDNLLRPVPQYWISRWQIARITSGFVEKLLTFRTRHDHSIGVHSKADSLQITLNPLELTASRSKINKCRPDHVTGAACQSPKCSVSIKSRFTD